MSLDWMGKYRAYVEAMVRYGNAYAQACSVKGIISDPPIDSTELQVMEYILENEDLHQNMSQIANRLNISLSRFSKIANRLVKMGLLEKFHTSVNRKDVIIRLTDHAREVYREYSQGPQTEVWRKSFALLEEFPPELVDKITEMLDLHSHYLYQGLGKLGEQEKQTPELIKIE